MSQTMSRVLRIVLLILLSFGACLVFPRRATEAEERQTQPTGGLRGLDVALKGPILPQDQPSPKTSANPARKRSAFVQSLRNIGKAYYEQAKYVEAIEEFKKVIASGSAIATDHLNLGLALMQAG